MLGKLNRLVRLDVRGNLCTPKVCKHLRVPVDANGLTVPQGNMGLVTRDDATQAALSPSTGGAGSAVLLDTAQRKGELLVCELIIRDEVPRAHPGLGVQVGRRQFRPE